MVLVLLRVWLGYPRFLPFESWPPIANSSWLPETTGDWMSRNEISGDSASFIISIWSGSMDNDDCSKLISTSSGHDLLLSSISWETTFCSWILKEPYYLLSTRSLSNSWDIYWLATTCLVYYKFDCSGIYPRILRSFSSWMAGSGSSSITLREDEIPRSSE